MIKYQTSMLNTLSEQDRANIIDFIVSNADATIPLREIFYEEVQRNVGAELVMAYDGGDVIGVHMFRSARFSRMVNNNDDVKKALDVTDFILEDLVVTLMTAVNATYRGQGIGSTLYAKVEEAASAKGYKAFMPVMPSHSTLALQFLTGKAEENQNTIMLNYTDSMGFQMRIMPFAGSS
tara:strand:- start:1122 stop:1658 length:537 start_codon:yes stop_codon:yes gene_type:complete